MGNSIEKSQYSLLKNKDYVNIIINDSALTTDNFSDSAEIYLAETNEYLNNQKWFVDDDNNIFIFDECNIYYLYYHEKKFKLTLNANKANVKFKT